MSHIYTPVLSFISFFLFCFCRLQPVKPLNPLGQLPVSVVQGEIDNKSTGLFGEIHEKTKVAYTFESSFKGFVSYVIFVFRIHILHVLCTLAGS